MSEEGGAPEVAASPGRPRWVLPAFLFVLTLASTTLAGGPAFSATLMSILVAHEMGHYLVARHYGVEASLPHFIPFPVALPGTFGAVIGMDTEGISRNALIDIGAAGPIAGFVVAVPLMALGIMMSSVVNVSLDTSPRGFLGDSILSAAMIGWLQPDIPPGFDMEVSMVFYGAWAGFIVTSMNLMPIGQLDGGHVAYGVAPARAEAWGRRVYLGLIVFGALGLIVNAPDIAYQLLTHFDAAGLIPAQAFEATRPLVPWAGYAPLAWAVVGRLTGFVHPPVARVDEVITPRRYCAAAVCLVIAVLTFMPNISWRVYPRSPETPAMTDVSARP